ncbi:MAG: PHP domain-containing protein [Anaerolineae bacterium]|jgi:predicted metal-dependent phosphoesterase TrpH|nr:PHP domain-containing protein [Anaerolineae bacterium]
MTAQHAAGGWRVELHLHTQASKDSLVRPAKLLAHCQKIGIDKFAVTDHNVIEGALALKAIAPEMVIVGEEIATTQGELIGYFMSEWVPSGLDPMETISRLRTQGAVISVAHPFDSVRSQHWEEEALLAIVPYVDAIETFNARCLSPEPNLAAAEFAQSNGLLETVGSDAHSLWEVGRASLLMPEFEDAESFRSALAGARQLTRLSPAFVHLFSRYAVLAKKMGRLVNSK